MFIKTGAFIVMCIAIIDRFELIRLKSEPPEREDCEIMTDCCGVCGLAHGLHAVVFGQHIALQILPNVIQNHVRKPSPNGALVLSFHGSTGTGKSHVADVIVKHLYSLGPRSSFVAKFIATDMFATSRDSVDKIDERIKIIKERIKATTRRCARSTFIFDEADKMPIGLLGALAPYMDIHAHIDDVDYRKTIFIFLSRKGGERINDFVSKHFEQGLTRMNLPQQDLEKTLKSYLFKEANADFQLARLYSRKFIHNFIPFLPLERKHVIECAMAYLKSQSLPEDEALAQDAANYLSFVGTANFSTSGCKLISAKLNALIKQPAC